MEESVLLLTMMSMMVTAGVCSVLFNKLKMPAIIGYLLAGIILVNVFNLSENEEFSMETVEVLKDIGLVMLMFGIGMELNLEKIKKYGKIAFIVAVIQLPLMVLSGYGFGMMIFGLDPTAAIALGAIISGSSTAVVTVVLKSHERVTKEQADTLILVTIMEDIGQVIILSMVTPLFVGSSIEASDMVKLIVLIIIFMVASIVIGIKFVPRILDWIGDNTSAEVLLVMGVGLCFLMAWLSKYIGMSMAIGAFLMGVIISQSKFSHEICEKTEPMKEVFMAVFFISVGMEVTVDGFVNSLTMAIGILLIFMISKFVTVFIGYFVSNQSFEEGFVSSISLMAMGEFAFIISSEAYTAGAVTEEFYTAVISAALMSMIILPILAKKMYAISDWLSARRPQPFGYFAERAYSVRGDVYSKVESSPSLGDQIRSNLKKTYFCLLLMIVIEIIFIEFMGTMTEFVSELVKIDGIDSQYVAYIILMVVNFLLLVGPTYFLIRSIKSINKLVMDRERKITKDHTEEEAAKIRTFYEMFLNFSTLTLVIVIDFLIMAIVPGPFGAEKSSLIAVPIAVGIFFFSWILARRKQIKDSGKGRVPEE